MRQPAPSRPGPSVERVDAAVFAAGTGSPAEVTALTATLRRHWPAAERTAPDLACVIADGYSVSAWIDDKYHLAP